ncbi:sulfite exporter TauE/SafE family protein [Aneurinibacillus terranovensis]|uniref:sulfite exporter TauE/SafE family protein n=1 Tax=Aneurinibacillus terranovensis TaxID=278991 RepID=UPI00040BDCC5|nr:sulfite exporter TauE/SafE family protein [Aneurinibacillus terranovensis]
MTVSLIVTLLVVGFVGSFLSGLLGIGGAIINYPLLLFLPSALGVASYTEHEVSGMIAVQVFFSTLSGVLSLRKDKLIHYKLVVYMGAAIIVGSLLGAYGGKFLSGSTINTVYAILATIAAIMMFVPKKSREGTSSEEITFNAFLAVTAAFIVGITSGIVGAGGAFILVPIMLTVLKIPTRVTIASSLAITFMSSIGATVGKIMAGHILIWPSIIIVIASLLAAPLGTKVSKRINAKALQGILAVLILATALKIWWDLLIK